MRATHIELTGLRRAFAGRTVLDLDRLDIAAGRITVLLGRSGCGKSTLLNLIAGLDVPDAGEIRVDGAPVQGQPAHTALIFQHNNLFPWMSAAQNIAFALENQGRPPTEARAEAQRLLGEVELAAFADYRPAKLSGGMRQRVALARAMALAPRLLILDEPFSALDMQTRRMMQRYLLDVWQRTGCSVLMVTHDLHEALMLADRIVLMSSTPVGHVADVLDIDLPRPRDADSDAFRLLQKQLDAFLEHEAVCAEFDSPLNAAA